MIVETSRGLEFGEVVLENREVSEEEIVSPLRVVRRIATEADYKQLAENKQKEKEAISICQEKMKSITCR